MLCGLVALAGPSAAQTVVSSSAECGEEESGVTLYGIVVPADGRGALAHAYVSIGTGSGQDTLRVLTDHRGVYLVCDIRPGHVVLGGHLSGYSSQPVELDVGPGDPVRTDLVIDFDGPPAAWERPDRAVAPGRIRGRLASAGGSPDGDRTIPIAWAVLSLVSTEWTALSDEEGGFEFDQVLAGPHVLRIDHVAHGTMYWPVYVPSGATVVFNAELSPVAIDVDPIVVTAIRETHLEHQGFYDRRAWGERTGQGFFLTREQIETWNPSRTSVVMSRAPGFEVQCRGGGRGCHVVSLRGQGRCPQAVLYLDGIKVTSLGQPIDDFVQPSDIAAVEAYTGMGDLSGEFADDESQRCGAVAIWTRRGGG